LRALSLQTHMLGSLGLETVPHSRNQKNAYIKLDALMTTMKPLFIRPLEQTDLEFAYKLNMGERWNDRKEDLLRMYNYQPGGCFIAEVEKKPVGHVFSVTYGKLGWLGLLIVKAEYRRKGIATQLMNKAIDYLSQLGVQTIKLEAAAQVSELYRKLGFADEYGSLRLSKAIKKSTPRMKDSPTPIKKENINEIATLDKKYFGADRTRVIAGLFTENPQLCFACYDKATVDGYIMCRKAKNGYTVGPFVCNPENLQIAEGLLQACMNRLENTTLYIGVPETNRNAVDLLTGHGFVQYSRSIRMRLGPELIDEKVRGIFAIGGPMKG
jgi:ribosomal protein S18 acetylase RimI-like enzyme